MKIALIGATGFIGQYLLSEAIARKHQVTALVRAPEKVAAAEGVNARKLDVNNTSQVTQALAGHTAVIV